MDIGEAFKIYRETLLSGIDKVKKSGYKKLPLFKEMIQTFEVYISKEVYGRIVPGNYALLFILMLGSRNSKLVQISIKTLQKLFSHGFIHENQELSLNFMKDDFKQFLLIDYQSMKNKTLKEIYIESLIQIPDRQQAIIGFITKSISLVLRLYQHALEPTSIRIIYQYLFQQLTTNKNNPLEKLIKSTLVQIVRHVLENLREIQLNILADSDRWSIKKFCNDQLTFLVDQVVLRDAVQNQYGNRKWSLIPSADNLDAYEYLAIETVNQQNRINGKFGWCINCRAAANFYCKNLRVPVCSFACKTSYFNENQEFQKLLADENKAQENFIDHAQLIIKSLIDELMSPETKRRTIAIEVLNFVLTEPRRFRSSKNYLQKQFNQLFRNCLINIVNESEIFTLSLLVIKKLLYLGLFLNQTELFVEMMIRKLENIQTVVQLKLQVLKLLRELFTSQLLLDLYCSFDCQFKKKNCIQNLLKSLMKVYSGQYVPQNIVFQEDNRVKKLCFDIIHQFINYIKELDKKKQPLSPNDDIFKIKQSKQALNQLWIYMNDVNNKPEKGIKKFIQCKLIENDPASIAYFFHKHLQSLNSFQVGEFIGGHSDLCKATLPKFIQLIDFKGMELDYGMRHLLDHFTLPPESQQVDRIIDAFSIKFHKDNSNSVFASGGAVYSLSFLMMMLQTNLHSPQVVDKMKMADIIKLSKGMNDGADFSVEYLQSLYNSIQKTQLGFHEKQKQKDFLAAFTQQSTKKLLDFHQKQTEKLTKRVISQFASFNLFESYRTRIYCVKLVLTSSYKILIQLLLAALSITDDSQQATKIFQNLETIIEVSIENGLTNSQQIIFQSLHRELTFDLANSKQIAIIQNLLQWSQKFTDNLGNVWFYVFSILSRFNKRKAIVKIREPRSRPLYITAERVCIQENFIEQLIIKSVSYSEKTLLNLIGGLVEVNRRLQIQDGQQIYSLQKIGEVVQINLGRMTEIFSSIWPILRDYYIELGTHRNQRLALFGVDFLKQTVSKFMKRKQTLNFQRQFLKPYESIFLASKVQGIKEYIIGSLMSIATHSSAQLRYGWKIILSVLANSFQQQELAQVKAKSYQTLVKIIDGSLPQLQQHYVDLIQVLVKLAKIRQQIYITGCISFIEQLIAFFNKKYGIIPKSTTIQGVDTNFLQSTWLPILGILPNICGDPRPQLQNKAVNYLFQLLMDYGGMFDSEFWKMVFQGVLRPAFDEILYTFQIRTNESNKKDINLWLKKSCEKLFESISELIFQFYQDFRTFLLDIFRIYQNCTQNSNQLLTRLSINAVKTLIERVGDKFAEQQWEHFLSFFKNLFKKTTPIELLSLQSWRIAKQNSDLSQNDSYGTKCLSQLMLLGVVQLLLQKFSMHLSDKHLQLLEQTINESYDFAHNFNKKIELRISLKQQGFMASMNELPGLLKQERESLKCLILVQYYRYQLAQIDRTEKYDHYIKTILKVLNLYVNKHRQLIQIIENQLAREQTQRQALNIRILVRDTVIQQLEQSGLQSLLPYKQQFFQVFIEMLKYCSTNKRPCLSCKRCTKCQENIPLETEFDDTINRLLLGIFNLH